MFLITTDLHLTDKPLDYYRFGLFPWLKDTIRKKNVKHLFLLGDLTDNKDKHGSFFVNRVVDEFMDLVVESKDLSIYLLMGNHDMIDFDSPFFKFLNNIPRLEYINKITRMTIEDYDFLFLPFSRTPVNDWSRSTALSYGEEARYIMMHQTIEGSVASNGFEMTGVSVETFKELENHPRIFSGDIHVPQNIGPVTYVGAPYAIRFNDTFEPRVIYIDGDLKEHDLHFETIKKHTLVIRDANDIYDNKDLYKGDQVKVRLRLRRAEFPDWPELRKDVIHACLELGVVLAGVELEEHKLKKIGKIKETESKQPIVNTPIDIFNRYSKQEGIDPYTAKIGRELIHGAQEKE